MKYRKDRELNGDKSLRGGAGGDVPPSVRLDIIEHHPGGGGGGGPGTGVVRSVSFSAPWTLTPGSGSARGGGRGRDPPEKQLTLFALRLAILEKAATGLGKLCFVWATVVLLGGFVGPIRITDFWCITVILVGEGARVFSRSHELEWQHHATETSTAGGALRHSSRFFRRILHAIVDHATAPGGGCDAPALSANHEQPDQHGPTQTPKSSWRLFRRVALTLADPAAAVVGGGSDASTTTTAAQFQSQIAALMKRRTGHAPPSVALVPYAGQVFASRSIGRLLNWLQVLSALACIALSLMRLWRHDFGGGAAPGNMRPALLLFYTLALLEALLFLLEKAYWAWKLSLCGLIHQVSSDCQLGPYGHVSLKRFFYDAYSRCVTGSVFDGVKMDLVTFAEELILSDFLDEQLIGVSILQQFATSKGSEGDRDTLRKVGTSTRSVERLVEMLNWKRPDEKQVRRSAAEVVSKLAGGSQNALRLSGIPGAIESVTSLLYTARGAPVNGAHPQPRPRDAAAGDDGYDYQPFNLLGLHILKKLAARDPDNCGKIGNARGLLAKIVDFTRASPELLRNPRAPDSQVCAVKRALQVLKTLVSTTGTTGKALREGVAENVFTVSNLRDILRYGRPHGDLRSLAVDVLTALALEKTGEEAIMGTGGLVKLLLSIFISDADEDKQLGPEAGGALAMLALESERGCAAVLRRTDVLQLVQALRDARRRLSAARVLRNLCAYSGTEHGERLRAVAEALPVVLGVTMAGTGSDDTVLEVCVGLTTQICRFVDGERFAAELRAAGVPDERAYVERLAAILRDNTYPQIKVPRMRRFVVLQVIWLMTRGGARYVELLRETEVGMEALLQSIADTTSELECYHVFSGSVGIGKHRESLSDIVASALQLITGDDGGAPAQE